jgi:hypothetical protein
MIPFKTNNKNNLIIHMLQRKRKKYFGVLILGLILASVVPLAIALIGILSPGQVMADTATSSVTVGNTRPTAGATTITSDDATPNDNTITQSYGDAPVVISCAGVITDENTCQEVTDVEAVIYTTMYGNDNSGCTVDNDNCFRISGGQCVAQGDCTDVNDTTVTYKCSVGTDFETDRTDNSGALDWRCAMRAKDGEPTWGTYTPLGDRDTSELATFRAVEITGSINYGSLPLSASTGTNHSGMSVYVVARGNAAMDVAVSGTSMDCTTGGGVGLIYISYQEYGTLSYFGTAEGVQLTASPAPVNLTFSYEGDPIHSGGPFSTLYFGLSMPDQDVSGICTGTNTFTAIEPQV